MERIKIFCLPFAGGSRYSYRIYETVAPSFLHLIPLEYPGRGNRVKEPFCSHLNLLVEDLYAQWKLLCQGERYAIYGHSLGGLLAYLLARKIIENNEIRPQHIFITGTSGPSAISRYEKKRHLLGKMEFIEEVKSLKGCPDEILDNEELLDFLVPILRADFKISENYLHQHYDPLPVPITVVTGMGEDISSEDIQLWQKECLFKVDFKRLPGTHFFIFQHPSKILEIFSRNLFKELKTSKES